MDAETVEQAQARHRKELKDLQGRITNKKKNATKKTRKSVNDECAELERALRAQHDAEIALLNGDAPADSDAEQTQPEDDDDDALAKDTEEKLRIREAAEPPPAARDTPPPQQQQQPGKKRNRQRERLARRAAEQEDAAARAEQEASAMTDHRAVEGAYMRTAMDAAGLVEQAIPPDGHCLFSAVADQLRTQLALPLRVASTTTAGKEEEEEEPAYRTVRREATAFMAAHADDFAPFVEGDFAAYLERMRDTAEWGGEPELAALAGAYGVGIRVVQDGRTREIGDGDGDGGRVIWLAYYRHGYGLGEHYNSLRRK